MKSWADVVRQVNGSVRPAIRIRTLMNGCGAFLQRSSGLRRQTVFALVMAAGGIAVAAQFSTTVAAAAESAELKVTRVALFSSGVGYFQCDSEISDQATAELRFRVDQINDILKSLVVQDFSGGLVGVVGYASQDPIEKSLKSFGVDITGKPTLAQLLDQLRGEPVRIASPRAVEGVILGVEKQRALLPERNVLETDVLTVFTESGLLQFPLNTLGGIELTNEKISGELRKALATLATGHDADRKTVFIRFEGQGTRKVRASYLIEAPIWKTSYRLVLSEREKPFLQGWAIVENATEDDWKEVRLSLVSGRPISFRMDLYTPLYVPRPLEELELYASLRPPKMEAGLEGERAEMAVATSARDMRRMAKAPQAAMRPAPVAGSEFGESEERHFDLAAQGVASVATAQEAGELFEYVIKTPVTIPRRNSAMLPIVNEPVEAEKLSVYNPANHSRYPLNALLLHNKTALNLMQGPVTVFDGNTYAGDAKLPDLKPDEKRLVPYALDLAVEVNVESKPCPDELVGLRIGKGVLYHKRKYADERTFTVKNKADRDKTVVLEHPAVPGWEVVEPKETYETTPTLLRLKVAVPAKKTVSQKLRMEHVAEQTVILTTAQLNEITFYLRSRVISPKVQAALEKVVVLRTGLDQVSRRLGSVSRDLETARSEQGRIRQNISTLDRSTDVYQRQLRKFDELETQIEQLAGQQGELRTEEEKKRKELEDYLLSLNVD